MNGFSNSQLLFDNITIKYLLADSVNTTNVNVAGTSNLAGDINIAGNINSAGNTNIANDLNVQNNIVIGGAMVGNLLPSQTLEYNLGSDDLRWNKLNVGLGGINIAGPTGSAPGIISSDENSIVSSHHGFSSPFINVGITGGWKISSSGDDLVAQLNNNGTTYSLTNKDGLTGPAGPTGATGMIGATGMTGATGPSGIMSVVSIPNSSGNIAVTATIQSGDISSNFFTFTPTSTGLFLIQIPRIYSTSSIAAISPLYETRMIVDDVSGIIATDSRFFTLNTGINPANASTNGGTWSGSLTCYANITTLQQKTVRIYLTVGSGINKLARVQWNLINIIPVQTNSVQSFVNFP